MIDNNLYAVPREANGKGPARQIRLHGRIPGVFYYRSDQNVPFSVDSVDLLKILRGKHALINLNIEGLQPRECVVREIQRDPIEDDIIHIDLMGIKRGQKLTVTIPVRLIGVPVGVKTGGGILQSPMNELEIECLPKDIPSEIEVDVTDLEIGHSRHISDLDLPALKILHDPDELIASVVPPTVIREPVEEAVEEEAEEEEKGEEEAEKEGEESAKGK